MEILIAIIDTLEILKTNMKTLHLKLTDKVTIRCKIWSQLLLITNWKLYVHELSLGFNTDNVE